MRPDFVTNEDILKWSEAIDSNNNIPNAYKQSPIIREVMYAGQWLTNELHKQYCPDTFITRIIYTAGKLCYGRQNEIWSIHQDLLNQYNNNTLIFEG